MRIYKANPIYGISMLDIRKFFRLIRNSKKFFSSDISDYFCFDKNETSNFISELISNDLIEPFEDGYKLTLKGNALCVAKCIPPINREKADKIFKEFMQRVEEINNDDYYSFRISKLYLFGSYLNTNNPDYGDIDIIFDLERKIKDNETFINLNSNLVYEAQNNGRYFSSFFDKIYYSQYLVLLKLKNKNRYISLHYINEISYINEYKQIFP